MAIPAATTAARISMIEAWSGYQIEGYSENPEEKTGCIVWAVNGILADYIKENKSSDAFRLRLARQIIEFVRFIHERGTIHSAMPPPVPVVRRLQHQAL